MPKKQKKPREIWTLDCETDPFLKGRVPKPFLWGLYTGYSYHEFKTPKEVAEYLREHEVVVYAHNGGKFDYHYLLAEMNLDEPIMIINGRLAKFKIGKCEMRDSFNILPVPLSAYKKDEIDYSTFEESERHKPRNWEAIRGYLKTDCIYLREFITQFIESYGEHLTQAGAAMKTWEKMTERDAPVSNRDYYEFFRPYYYGGRVQCFEKGKIKRKFKVADINSAYPRAMLDKHPIGTTFDILSELPTDDRAGPSMVEVECVAKGCFPFRVDNKLYFPADNVRRTYTVTGWELLAARDTGAIEGEKILTVYAFRELIDFADYINHFYNLRLSAKELGDIAADIFAKLLMNSLYGKFGSNPDEYKEYVAARPGEEDALKAEGYAFAGMIGPHIVGEKPLPDYKQRYFNVATSASITGWVRAYLWRAICKSKHPIYCDTDSIAAEGFDLEFGKGLGFWKDEGTFSEGYIAGKKMYAFKDEKTKKWKTASKGVRMTHLEIKKLAEGERVTYEPEVPTYSIRKEPRFTNRTVGNTAEDISVIPV